MIYISRNPKDTAVSMFHYYRDNPNLPTVDTWTAFFDLFLKGNGKDKCFLLAVYVSLLCTERLKEFELCENSLNYLSMWGWWGKILMPN